MSPTMSVNVNCGSSATQGVRLVVPDNCELLQCWLQQIASDPSKVRQRLSNGEWETLSDGDRSLLLAFMEKKQLLHNAVRNHNLELIALLHQAGMNINGLDGEGKSPLQHAYVEPDIFNWLFWRGARYPQEQGGNSALLSEVLSTISYFSKNIDKDQKSLSELLKLCTVDDLLKLDKDKSKQLFILTVDAEVQKLLIDKLQQALNTPLRRFSAMQCIKKTLYPTYSYNNKNLAQLTWLLSLLQQGILSSSDVEEILSDAELFHDYLQHFLLLQDPQYGWKPSEALKKLIDSIGDFCLAFRIHVLLQSKTLKDAATYLENMKEETTTCSATADKLQEAVRRQILMHIEALQQREQRTFWQALAERSYSSGDRELCFLESIGFDPNWSHPHSGEHLLFTELAWYIGDETRPCHLKVDLNKCNDKGENALEFHCRVNKKFSDFCRKALVTAGLSLSDAFPASEKCRKLFPESPLLQAEFACLLLHPCQDVYQKLLRDLKRDEKRAIESAIDADKELCALLRDFRKQKDSWKQEVRNKSMKWEELLEDGEGKKLLRPHCTKSWIPSSFHIAQYAYLSGKKISTQALHTIPGDPIASLAVLTLRERHSVRPDVALSLYDTLSSCKRSGVARWVRHLFDNPELMKIFVDDYLQLKTLVIAPGGGVNSTFSESVYDVIISLKKLRHWPDYEWNLSRKARKQYKKLDSAYNAHIIPQPVDRLVLPDEKATISIAGRTVFVSNGQGKGIEAFKFLKRKYSENPLEESYKNFSRELPVTQVFQELGTLFQSRFHSPLGLYLLRELPKEFPTTAAIGAAPAFVYHYSTSQELMRYPQELSCEEFATSRQIWLGDEASMVRRGYTPQSAALFHNNSQQRGYSCLIDLAAQIARRDDYLGLTPQSGAGRLDQPFFLTCWPNRRAGGITDLGDGHLFYNQQKHKIQDLRHMPSTENASARIFHQMNNLGNILLVDMLLLVAKEQKAGLLDWRSEVCLVRLSEQLLLGYATVVAGYSKETLEKTQHFARHSGIDWPRMALQVAFWCDNGPEGYPAWVARDCLPDNLYEVGAKVEVNAASAQNFHPITGFQSAGHQDIGPFNGPLCLTEFEKAIYTLFIAVILAEPLEKKIKQAMPSYSFMDLFM